MHRSGILKRLFIVILTACCLQGSAARLDSPDAVEGLPGAPDGVDFGLHAGNVVVDDGAGRSLFYVMAEASSDAATAPLVLWLNGGPGCSSLGGGFMSELGPFYPNKDGATLQLNTHRWNKIANVIFLESPAFVGFSYSNTSDDLIVGDKRTADDALVFLIEFFKRFPDLQQNDFWIAGESYGGHYVPNLAAAVLRHNRHASNDNDTINLQGFLVGNPWTDPKVDNTGAVEYWWTHAIVSDAAAHSILRHCDMARIGPLLSHDQSDAALSRDTQPLWRWMWQAAQTLLQSTLQRDSVTCTVSCIKAFSDMGRINIYDIYVDVCPAKAVRANIEALASVTARGHPLFSSTDRSEPHAATAKYDPCVDDEVERYLNLPEVQAALHANTSGQVAGPWRDCNSNIQYMRQDIFTSMLPVYRHLLKAGVKMLVYSGDVDAIVPVVGTRRWTSLFGLREVVPWRPWYTNHTQVGGYVVRYSHGLTFATVRGAGHMVPYTQPARAYQMFSKFILDESF